MDGTEKFCEDSKLFMDPKEATSLDLIHLLFSSDIKSRRFVDCPEEQGLVQFNHRWLIFISVLAQKILLYFQDPLARIGHAIETWLNLVAINGGLFMLLVKSLQGDVVWPDRSSASFRSVVGNLDKRVEIEKSIKSDHAKYKSVLTLMAAKLSYENEALIKSIIKDR